MEFKIDLAFLCLIKGDHGDQGGRSKVELEKNKRLQSVVARKSERREGGCVCSLPHSFAVLQSPMLKWRHTVFSKQMMLCPLGSPKGNGVVAPTKQPARKEINQPCFFGFL